MKIAVMTLCRDRLDYTKHCLQSLYDNAGCEFDHYVLDQGSEDGTTEWLDDQDLVWPNLRSFRVDENIGVSAGLNYLVDQFEDDYDVVAHFDNDCEVVTENCLRDLAHLVFTGGAILSPRILGLNNPPQTVAERRIGDETILEVPQVGGIFLTHPGWIYDDFRYTAWSWDDVELCYWWRQQGGTVGYVKRLEAWHYESSNGQRERYPEYFERSDAEYAARELERDGLRVGRP